MLKMKSLLKLEELTLFAASIVAFNMLDYSWWWYPTLILLPDIGMLGYAVNSKMGAITYNIFHHKALAMGLYLLGLHFNNQPLMLSGVILFGHSSLDRVFGYGLKLTTGFHHTHLGNLKE